MMEQEQVGSGNEVTPVYVSQLDACPSCGEGWLYGEGSRFSRIVGVYDVRLDRTVAWRCPDCGQEWDRNAVATLIGRSDG